MSEKLFRRFYPDKSRSGTLAFYDWVRSELTADSWVLNLGAGGATRSHEGRPLKGTVARLVGADIDPAVLDNEELDEGHVFDGVKLPFDAGKFDLIYSDFVMEHVEHPRNLLSDVCRVLRPGGSFFFRTPNRFHYTALISQATPHWFHVAVANKARGMDDDAHDPWPTFYRFNSSRRVKLEAREAGFEVVELRPFEGEPSYLVFHAIPFVAGVAYERFVNRFNALGWLRSVVLGKLTKPSENGFAARS